MGMRIGKWNLPPIKYMYEGNMGNYFLKLTIL